MKLKFLLLFFAVTTLTWAQEPNRNLVITEAFMVNGQFNDVYFEITNMGETPVDLSEITFNNGFNTIIFDPWNDPWAPGNSNWRFYLPESVSRVLQPGESYVLTIALDYGVNMYNARIPEWGYANRAKRHDIYQYADFLAHRLESDEISVQTAPNVKDSVTAEVISLGSFNLNRDDPYIPTLGYCHSPNIGFFIMHHFAEGDSATIDQVGCTFEMANGRSDQIPDAVAGVADATTSALLVRKSNIVDGNLDFNSARGVGLDDSEWIAILYPEGTDGWRDTWWTVGNHGNYVLDENTLEPKTEGFDVDFGAKTITVPWGTRRLDEIMRNMKYKPGVAWRYDLNPSREDSLLRSAQTGDSLTVYVVGETLTLAQFEIVVQEPTQDANIVIPIDHIDQESIKNGGPITDNTQNGKLGWPRVTNHDNGIDTIYGGGYGIPHAMRTDTLLKYLEKPENASWEFVFTDGIQRADLKTGDKLKVIAQNGDVKEYFIEVQSYTPSHNATVASITWPDIDLSFDEFYKEVFGWTGDTIPNFSPNNTGYRITIPYDVDVMPSLVAKTQDLNASVAVERASTLEGTVEDRTISFEVTAEDDSVKNVYSIELEKEKDPVNVQPFSAEPFVSEMVIRMNQNSYIEICNPGNQMLDLSNYMMISARSGDPAFAITQTMGADDWMIRFRKYVPGYKWVSQIDWSISPGVLERDLAVSPLVEPGGVFVMGNIKNDDHVTEDRGYAGGYENWWIPSILDVQFQNSVGEFGSYSNPWGEELNNNITPIPHNLWDNFFLFKILNDSVKSGLKPADDPNDFELIDVLGMETFSRWYNGGQIVQQRTQFTRKPEIVEGNPVVQASFGTNLDDTEWIIRTRPYYGQRGIPGSTVESIMTSDLGKHFFKNPTSYMSTVTALVYKVSKGYTWNESIKGIITGTTTAEFLQNIFKADSAQTLIVKSFADGNEMAMDAALSLNDTLVVISADSTNTTKYVLEVNDQGLSSNALISSARYDIEVTTEPQSVEEETGTADGHIGIGTVTGFEYGTQLSTILKNIVVPAGARLTVVDNRGAYVPLTQLNFDTTNVSVTVTHNQFLEVVAENGVTTILYQLQPQASESEAFITSDIYSVDQNDLLVEFVPRGTAVKGLLMNVVPSLGASVKVIDKFGMERTIGNIVQDDRILVTSADGTVQTVYYLSMLRSEFVPETTYLAYVTSKVYAVDQLNMKISGATGTTDLSTFLNRIDPAMGATAFVVDSEGNEKTSGDLDDGDMLKVVSADGKIEAMYALSLNLTDSELNEITGITLYPNPTNGILNVSGVKVGNRIQVFNSTGTSISQIDVQRGLTSISLENQPAGMYLIVITDKNELLGRFKAVKQ